MSQPEAFYNEEHRCWFVPVAVELLADESLERGVEPCRVELKDKQLWITQLGPGEEPA